MAKNVLGDRLPVSGWLPSSQSRRSPRAPSETLPVPTPPFWGVREIPVDLNELYHHLDTHVLFKLHWGGRGVKGEAWQQLVSEDFQPRLERMWAEQDYLRPRALLGYFPCYSDGNDLVVWTDESRAQELARFTYPRQREDPHARLIDHGLRHREVD